MFVDVARLLALVFCMLSLCAVFHTAFLVPASDLEQRIWDSLSLLALAAGISLVGGLVFREAIPEPYAANTRLTAHFLFNCSAGLRASCLFSSLFPGTWKATAFSTA